MSDLRDLTRRLDSIEDEDGDQSPEEWAEEFAAQQSSEASWVTEDVDPDHDPPAKETDEGILVTVYESDEYWAPFRASREEIPNRFDPEEDFPV